MCVLERRPELYNVYVYMRSGYDEFHNIKLVNWIKRFLRRKKEDRVEIEFIILKENMPHADFLLSFRRSIGKLTLVRSDFTFSAFFLPRLCFPQTVERTFSPPFAYFVKLG